MVKQTLSFMIFNFIDHCIDCPLTLQDWGEEFSEPYRKSYSFFQIIFTILTLTWSVANCGVEFLTNDLKV